MNTKTMLLEFCQQTGIPGVNHALEYGTQLLSPYGKVEVSPLGSLVCTVKEPKENQPHILLDAHIDEIGLMVTRIEDNGFLRVAQFGGTDPRLLAATRVTIHSQTGDHIGVICSTPPHLSTKEDTKAPTADKIYIDTGMTSEEAKNQISLGDRISFHTAPVTLLNDRISVKALDDRAGCVSLIKALEYLNGDIPCGLTVMFSTMEEIGGMGAKTSAYAVNPTHGLAVDVSFATTPDSPSEKCGELGKGPMIGFAPTLDHNISQRLVELATQENIPYQHEIMGGRTGTNADSIVTIRGGVKTALLSIPLCYMHMPIEVVDPADVDATGQLIAAWIKDLGTGGNC